MSLLPGRPIRRRRRVLSKRTIIIREAPRIRSSRRKRRRPNTDKKLIKAGKFFKKSAGSLGRVIKTKTSRVRENIKRRKENRIEVAKY